jgi:hypothetical protein
MQAPVIRQGILRKRRPYVIFNVWTEGQPWQGAYYADGGKAQVYAVALLQWWSSKWNNA